MSKEIEQKTAVARNVMRLLDEWGLASAEIIQLLALPAKTRTRHLDKYRGQEPFPPNEQTELRIQHIAGIADALRTSYPRNAHMGSRWLRTPHRRMQNKTPLQLIIELGLPGLLQVRSELDCAFSWDRSGS